MAKKDYIVVHKKWYSAFGVKGNNPTLIEYGTLLKGYEEEMMKPYVESGRVMLASEFNKGQEVIEAPVADTKK